jgi:GNAT superfamily N-acetyltransferase
MRQMMIIVKIDKEESDIVADIIRKSFSKQAYIMGINHKDYPNYVAFETSESINSKIENGEVVLLAWLDDIPIGTVRYIIDKENPLRGYINRLAVIPEYRGNAHGKILMDYAEEKLLQSGVEEIEISIVKKFEKLEKYYEDLGYKYVRDQSFPSLPFEVRFMVKSVKTKGGNK